MDDSGRVVLITGGSRGIGRAIAFRFAGEKPKLVLLHYDPDDSAAKETLDRLAGKGVQGEAHRLDVSDRGEVDRLFKDVLSRFGRVDVLVNNAGITKDGLLMRMSEDEWDLVIRVNLKGVFNCTQAVIRSMIKERAGRIVNISSVVGQMGNAGQTNYSASKAVIIGFTKSLAREVAALRVPVFFGGHTHELVETKVAGLNSWGVVSGEAFEAYSRVDLDIEPTTGAAAVRSVRQVWL